MAKKIREPVRPPERKGRLTRSEAAWVAGVSVHLLDQLSCRGGGPKFVFVPGSLNSVYERADVVEWARLRAARIAAGRGKAVR